MNRRQLLLGTLLAPLAKFLPKRKKPETVVDFYESNRPVGEPTAGPYSAFEFLKDEPDLYTDGLGGSTTYWYVIPAVATSAHLAFPGERWARMRMISPEMELHRRGVQARRHWSWKDGRWYEDAS